MYTRQQLISAVKSLAKGDESLANSGHCQRLRFHAQKLGFKNFEQCRRWLLSAPSTSLGSISTSLMEQVCAGRLPSLDGPYVEFTAIPSGISYYSQWIGWDRQGNEVRVPRPLDAQYSVPRLRGLVDHPVYVVESDRELLSWLYGWKATAYLPEELAKEFFGSFFDKEHFIDPNVSDELIQLRAAERRAEWISERSKAKRRGTVRLS